MTEQERNLQFQEKQMQINKAIEEQTVINQETIEMINNKLKKQEKAFSLVCEEFDGRIKVIENIAKETNIISHPIHRALFTRFKKSAASRIYKLLGDNTVDFYLFKDFLFKNIYTSIANFLDIPSWQYISMEDYEEPGSMYDKARIYRDSYMPSRIYIDSKIDELKKRRDIGALPAEKCRLLTEFLDSTNNGKNIPFVF